VRCAMASNQLTRGNFLRMLNANSPAILKCAWLTFEPRSPILELELSLIV